MTRNSKHLLTLIHQAIDSKSLTRYGKIKEAQIFKRTHFTDEDYEDLIRILPTLSQLEIKFLLPVGMPRNVQAGIFNHKARPIELKELMK